MANIEAVKIWVGSEWVEIAQPIAEGGNDGDVLTWSGGEWVAAAPAEHKLPTESVDGTVVLDSPASGTFTVSAVGAERFRIRPNGSISLAQSASVPTTGSNNTGITQRFDLNNNGMLLNSTGYATNACNTAYGLWFQINSNADPGTAHTGTFICLMIGTTTVQTGTTINEWRGVSIGSQTVPDKAYAYHTTMAPRAGKERYAIYCEGSAPSRFDGQVMLPPGDLTTLSISLTGESTGISFNSNTILFATGGVERMRITPQGHLTAADTYYPVVDQDLATAKYVNDGLFAAMGRRYTTAEIGLANPTRSLGRFSPPTGLATQEDANQAIGDAIAERKIVLPISRAEYDALADKDPDTLYLITS